MAYKVSSENLALANIKNRSQISHLHAYLDKIEKEKQNELRMDNNEKQRFRAKYTTKLIITGDESIVNQASDVKMYETHNPGFCFKRNGEHKVLQQPMPKSISFDFEHLRFLLFTDGEVDIEKVLCLHLLSTHETEHLTPPSSKQIKADRLTYNQRNSPMEQLIERSKNKNALAITSSTTLPIYVLDIKSSEENSKLTTDGKSLCKKSDNRLVARLLINEKILGLITTVMTALENSNPEKMAVLQAKAHDVDALKEVLTKTHIQAFTAALKGHALVCCSFVLSQPFKIKPIRLNVGGAVSEHLTKLLKYIYSSVLQLPTKAYLKQMYENSKIPETGVVGPSQQQSPRSERRRHSERGSPRSSQQVKAAELLGAEDAELTRKNLGEGSKTSQQLLLEETSKFRHSSVNFVTKNIKDVAEKKASRQPYQELQKARRESNESKRSARHRKSSFEATKRRSASTSSTSSTSSPEGRRPSSPPPPVLSSTESITAVDTDANKSNAQLIQHNHDDVENGDDIKVHSKQTTCAACMEKWKVPLPVPRTSKLNQSREAVWIEAVTSKDDMEPPERKLKTNHERQLMNLIEQEEYRLYSYDRKYSKYNSNTSSLGSNKPKRQTSKDTGEFADFDVYDLEKIKQVIREKEAQKKLQHFLAVSGPGKN